MTDTNTAARERLGIKPFPSLRDGYTATFCGEDDNGDFHAVELTVPPLNFRDLRKLREFAAQQGLGTEDRQHAETLE